MIYSLITNNTDFPLKDCIFFERACIRKISERQKAKILDRNVT